jgi:hypothetical protein
VRAEPGRSGAGEDRPEEATVSLYDDGDADGEPSTIERTVACKIRVNYPHVSGHISTRVNVDARVDCEEAVPTINLAVGLWRDGQEVAQKMDTAALRSWLRVFANTPCVPGTYEAIGIATVHQQPGFVPRQLTLVGHSGAIHIPACP